MSACTKSSRRHRLRDTRAWRATGNVTMPTRWILAGWFAFSVAAVLGFAMALAGPVAPLRQLGTITALMGVFGAIIHAQLLQDTDPHAWSVVRYRIAEIPSQLRTRLTRLHSVLRPHADAT